jgi:hypothetical protein
MDSIQKTMTSFIENVRQGQPHSGHDLLAAARYPNMCRADPHALLHLIGQAINHLHTHRKTLQDEERRLLSLNPVQATPHYRRDANGEPKYLYLIHPTQANGQRQREYIGADPAAQAAALARIKAHDDLLQIQCLISTASQHLDAINENLARALLAATRGPDAGRW